MRKRMLIIIGFCFFGLLLLNPVFVKASEGKTEIEVNIFKDSSAGQLPEEQSSEKEKPSKNTEESQNEKNQMKEADHSGKRKKLSDFLPKTGNKNQYGYVILGITITLISVGFIIKKYLEEKNDEKN
ncbi:LPXTG cell wall anchor domain-containing protein [Carnobacterium maltaromaticum]|uniref:LPXTG cell wall anchor domain-containing protein n=1 Tax=Carnobacterium maltaromaticum TaxID=2751 RepID=UPI00165BD998|nr:LPXTG cell wall anchor domain-containing protein [Carnobacterium maltaromaticum]MBC9810727.1 LPXTG cell wall anchor domain-containing protein [Carnobacterium maltaromaticum]